MWELVLSRVRHPSFSSAVAERLLHGLSRHQLRQLWDESSTLLETPVDDGIRLALVVLRDHLLRELERTDPLAVQAWLAAGHPVSRRRRPGR